MYLCKNLIKNINIRNSRIPKILSKNQFIVEVEYKEKNTIILQLCTTNGVIVPVPQHYYTKVYDYKFETKKEAEEYVNSLINKCHRCSNEQCNFKMNKIS